MAIHRASVKDIRRTRRATGRNRAATTEMRTAVRKVLGLKKKDEAEVALREAVSLIDKNVKRNLVHRNNAARKKALLYRALHRLDKKS
jgi:small subunit ribosomal protein S20